VASLSADCYVHNRVVAEALYFVYNFK